MTFECPRCGHISKLKTDMKKHLRKKKICSPILSYFTQQECLKMIEMGEFVSIDVLKNKLRMQSKQIETQKDELNKKDERIKELEQLNILVNTQGKNLKGNHNTNCNNDTTIINLHVNSYENTNYTVLKDKLNNCVENGKVNEAKLLKLLHFNKDHPENHNIKIDNRRDNRIMTFNGEEFEEKHSGVDGVWDFLDETLQNVSKDETVDDELFMAIEETDIDNKELKVKDKRKKIKNISQVLYNGKAIVNKTHKKSQSKILSNNERKLLKRK